MTQRSFRSQNSTNPSGGCVPRRRWRPPNRRFTPLPICLGAMVLVCVSVGHHYPRVMVPECVLAGITMFSKLSQPVQGSWYIVPGCLSLGHHNVLGCGTWICFGRSSQCPGMTVFRYDWVGHHNALWVHGTWMYLRRKSHHSAVIKHGFVSVGLHDVRKTLAGMELGRSINMNVSYLFSNVGCIDVVNY